MKKIKNKYNYNHDSDDCIPEPNYEETNQQLLQKKEIKPDHKTPSNLRSFCSKRFLVEKELVKEKETLITSFLISLSSKRLDEEEEVFIKTELYKAKNYISEFKSNYTEVLDFCEEHQIEELELDYLIDLLQKLFG